MHQKKFITAGKALSESDKALIMIHGRGASAEDILSLSGYLSVSGFAIIAPQATNHTWYPHSFLANPEQNEPWLSSALLLINSLVLDVVSAGISKENIFFLGFSQGACLTLEYTTRFARRWGGIFAFSGGLIGDRIYMENYKGNFMQTPVFAGSSDPDPHVPAERVLESAEVLRRMNASVTLKIYKNMGHTISDEEIEMANKVLGGIT